MPWERNAAQRVGQGVGVRRDRAALARGDRLHGVERERAHVGTRAVADRTVGRRRAERVRGVLDDARGVAPAVRPDRPAARRSAPRPTRRTRRPRPGRGSTSSGRCRRSRRSRRRSAAQFALATNDSGEVSTRSPGPMPAAESAPCSAAVPLAKATACAAPVCAHSARSKSSIAGSAGQPVAAEHGDDRGDVVVLDELTAIRDHTSQFGDFSADLSG